MIDFNAWRRNIREDVQVNYHAGMAWALLAEGSNEPAAGHFRRVLDIDPTIVEARWGLARSTGQDHWDGPAEGAARALTQLAKTFLLRGRRPEAMVTLQSALKQDCNCAESHLILARLQAEDKQWTLVLEHASRAGTLAPDNAAEAGLILHHAAGQCLAISDFSLAEQLARESCRLSPDSAIYWELLANILLSQAKYAEAFEIYGRIDVTLMMPSSRFGLAACCLLQGAYRRGLLAMDGVLEAGHDPILGSIVASDLRMAEGDGTGGLALVAEALVRHPDSLLLTAQKAFLLGECKETDHALSLIDGITTPDLGVRGYLQFRRAGILQRAGRLAEARTAARIAIMIAPDRLSNYRQFARILAADHQQDQAAMLESRADNLLFEPFNPARWLPPA